CASAAAKGSPRSSNASDIPGRAPQAPRIIPFVPGIGLPERDRMNDVPLVVLIATVWTYWLGVAIMVLRVRRRNRKLVGLVPEQWLERVMWLVWVPSVAAWIFLPYAALRRADALFGL